MAYQLCGSVQRSQKLSRNQRWNGESACRRGSVQIRPKPNPVWPSICAAYLEVAFAGRDARTSRLTLLPVGFT